MIYSFFHVRAFLIFYFFIIYFFYFFKSINFKSYFYCPVLFFVFLTCLYKRGVRFELVISALGGLVPNLLSYLLGIRSDLLNQIQMFYSNRIPCPLMMLGYMGI